MKILLISNINLIFIPNLQGTARECENQTVSIVSYLLN